MKKCRPAITPLVAILTIAPLYNLALSMVITMVPLFVNDLGAGPKELGLIVSVAGLSQIFMLPFTGSATDRWSEKRVMVYCVLIMAFSGLLYIAGYSRLIWVLIAQLFNGFSRAAFWPSAQSYVTKIPGKAMGEKVGYFHTLASIGNVIKG